MHFLLGRYGYAHQIRPSISWEDWTAVPAPFVILDCICPPSSRSSSRLAPTRDFSRLLNAGLSCLCSYLALSVSLSPLAQKRKLLAPRPSVRPVPFRDTESEEEENERIKSKARCLAPFYASTPTFFFFLFVRISKNLGVTHNLALALDDTFFFILLHIQQPWLSTHSMPGRAHRRNWTPAMSMSATFASNNSLGVSLLHFPKGGLTPCLLPNRGAPQPSIVMTGWLTYPANAIGDLRERHRRRCEKSIGKIIPTKKRSCERCISFKVKCDYEKPSCRT